MEKLKDFGSYKNSDYIMWCCFYGVFVCLLVMPAAGKYLAYYIGFGAMLVYIPSTFVFLHGREDNRRDIMKALKWAEENPGDRTEYNDVEFEADFNDFVGANRVINSRRSRMILNTAFFWVFTLFNMYMILIRGFVTVPLILLTLFGLVYALYPVVTMIPILMIAYQKQKDNFGKQKIEITPEGIKETNNAQESLYRALYEIHVGKDIMVVFYTPRNFLLVRNNYFKSEDHKNYFISRAYLLIKNGQ